MLFFSLPLAAERQLIKIGVIAPFTGSAAHIGKEIQRTLNILSETKQFQSYKYSYKFIYEDGRAGVDNSPTTGFKKLHSIDKVSYFISATSGETLQIAHLAEKAHTPLIAVFATHKDIKNLGDYIFRTSIDVEKGIKDFIIFIKSKGHLPIAILTENHAFNIGIDNLFKTYLNKEQIEFAEIYQHQEADLRPILVKLKAHQPKSIYLNCTHPITCATGIKQIRQMGIKLPVYSFLHMDNSEFLEASKGFSEGMVFLATPDTESQSKKFDNFYQHYLTNYPEGTKNNFLMRSTYDAANTLIKNIEKYGEDTEKVKEGIYTYNAEGALGNISFDENGDIKGVEYMTKIIQNNRTIPLKRPNFTSSSSLRP